MNRTQNPPESTASAVDISPADTLRGAADDYDWAHAREDDLETYADACAWNETGPTREGFLTWLRTR